MLVKIHVGKRGPGGTRMIKQTPVLFKLGGAFERAPERSPLVI